MGAEVQESMKAMGFMVEALVFENVSDQEQREQEGL